MVYGPARLDPIHARKVLGAIADHRGVSLQALTAQLAAKVDQPRC
jgi:hypothetical protein